MEWGKNIAMFEGMANQGISVPALDNRPDISGFEWLWVIFMDLNTCRSIGLGLGPIPWTAVQKYTEVRNMSPFETLLVHHVIKSLDQMYLKHHGDKISQSKKR